MAGTTAAQTAEAFYLDLAPSGAGKDFRVAVACVFADLTAPDKVVTHIINRHERT
jgi:hypothetical protein